MTDKPILFSGPMVRAVLEGRKTQTRRVLKPPYGTLEYLGDGAWKPICTKFFPGDRLWVRESIVRAETDQGVGYQTYTACGSKVFPLTKWYHKRESLPSIHMPRWASRLTLTVTDVRVQRLQDISERDAIAEGVADGGCTECGGSSLAPEGCCYNPSPDFKDSFAFIWDSLNAKPKPVGGKITTHYVSYPWGGEPRTETYRGKPHHICPNPWVSATTFTAHRCNIDQME